MTKQRSKSSTENSLPLELWQVIAKHLGIKEWVKSCGGVCRAFNEMQFRVIDVRGRFDKQGLVALQWAAKHWKEAQVVWLGMEVRTLNGVYNPACSCLHDISP